MIQTRTLERSPPNTDGYFSACGLRGARRNRNACKSPIRRRSKTPERKVAPPTYPGSPPMDARRLIWPVQLLRSAVGASGLTSAIYAAGPTSSIAVVQSGRRSILPHPSR
jgi:hypothetical protein